MSDQSILTQSQKGEKKKEGGEKETKKTPNPTKR